MYLSHYGFQEKPFTITPNPRFIFLSKNHKEAFAHLLYGIRNRAGFITLTGEVGTGKTTVLRTLLSQLAEEGFKCALILNPCLSALDLLNSINREYGLASASASISEAIAILNLFLLHENKEGRTVVLVIDESQNLEPQVLEQIRLISNLETDTEKLIQIILAGQPELGQLLEKRELRQLAQRVTVSFHLRPMDREDTSAYIRHRLMVAGFWGHVLFTGQAAKRIFRFSGGIPRLINIICDRTLLIGYTEDRRELGHRVVKEAERELIRQGRGSNRRWLVLTCSFGAALIAAAILLKLTSYQATGKSTSVAAPSAPVATQIQLSPNLYSNLKAAALEADEKNSAVLAFNAIAGLWNVRALPMESSPQDFDRLAAERGVNLYRFSGGVPMLAMLDAPAVIEYSLPGVTGKRYLAVTGLRQGRVTVAPPLGGSADLSLVELQAFWSGVGFVAWRNFDDIPVAGKAETQGDGVLKLQRLMERDGLYKGAVTGVYDVATAEALKRFQASSGFLPDGKAGPLTLLLLYGKDPERQVPRLSAGSEVSKK